MRFSDLAGLGLALQLALLLALAVVQPAAACFVCDEVVELDQIRASCFLAEYDTFEQAIRQSQERRTEIDLSACAKDVATGLRGIDALPNFPTSKEVPETLKANLRSVYILDEKSVACVKQLLENRNEPIDPSIRIDLASAC